MKLLSLLASLSLLAVGTQAVSPSPEEVAAVKAAFEQAGIVPDVLPAFNPTALAAVDFTYSNGSSSGALAPGTSLPRNDTQTRPTLSVRGLSGSSEDRYVGVIVDPDAPSRANPTRRNIRHLLAGNLTVENGKTLVNTSTAASNFRGPNPPVGSGPHRYVFLLYEQPKDFQIVDGVGGLNLSDIAAWNLTRWTEATGLGGEEEKGPVAGTWFEVAVNA